MIHAASQRIAHYCVKQSWVKKEDVAWCSYAIEKKLLTALFFFWLTLCAFVCGKYIEMGAFTLVFFFLRRRIGGWHAERAWSCQILSVVLVLSNVFAVGPLLITHMPMVGLFLADIVVFVWALILKPIYPPQVHFGTPEKQANNKKKNQLLVAVLLIQIIAGLLQKNIVIVYSGLGVLTGIISVYIEQANQWLKERNVVK